MRIYRDITTSVALSLAVSLLCQTVHAFPQTNVSFSAGENYRAFEIDAFSTLSKDPYWDWNATYNHTQSGSAGVDTRAHLIRMEFAHEPDDVHRIGFGGQFWWDAESKVRYVGPRANYTLNIPSYGDEYFSPSIESEANFYTVPLETNPSTGGIVRRGSLRNPGSSTYRFTQIFARTAVEHSFFNQHLIPTVGYGRYFYSKSPSQIEVFVDRNSFLLSPAGASAVTNLLGGFLKQVLDASIRFKFEFLEEKPTTLTPSFSMAQYESDNTWTKTAGASLTQKVTESFSIGLSYTRTLRKDDPLSIYGLGFGVRL